MRWFALGSNEFAFLSIGAQAKGIIAIGAMAHGIVAIGGFLSVGVISIGMNAIGSVAAFGLNSVAPISLSLINALGIYVLAGVNGCGTFTSAGVNATGLSADGGTNSGRSFLPTLIVVVAAIVVTSIFRGHRATRIGHVFPTLPSFLESKKRRETVHARVVAHRDGSVELAGGDETLTLEVANEDVAHDAEKLVGQDVFASIERVREPVLEVGPEGGYRTAPKQTHEVVVYRCIGLCVAPKPLGWWPVDAGEVQWVIAWSARLAVLVTIAAIVRWAIGR